MTRKNEATAEPLYYKIRNDLLLAIRERRLRPDDKIPTEPELMEHYGVSRTTVRRAVSDLVTNGTLRKVQGAGTFVSAPKYTRHLVRVSSFTLDCERHHRDHETIVTQPVLTQPVLAEPHEEFPECFQPGERVYSFRRLRKIEGDPVMIEYNEVPEHFDFMEGIAIERLCSMVRLFEGMGVRLHGQRSVLDASIATRQEAELLNIRPGSPVYIIGGIALSSGGRLIYAFKQVVASERCKLDIGTW